MNSHNSTKLSQQLRFAVLFLSILSGVNSASGSEQTINNDVKIKTAETTFDVHHAVATDKGGIPTNLSKYGKYLRRAGSENWKLSSKSQTKPSPGSEKTVTLPGKLGKARISIDAKGVATVKIMDTSGKSLGSYRSSRFPLVIANQRLRIGGKPYVLILDRPKKK